MLDRMLDILFIVHTSFVYFSHHEMIPSLFYSRLDLSIYIYAFLLSLSYTIWRYYMKSSPFSRYYDMISVVFIITILTKFVQQKGECHIL